MEENSKSYNKEDLFHVVHHPKWLTGITLGLKLVGADLQSIHDNWLLIMDGPMQDSSLKVYQSS